MAAFGFSDCQPRKKKTRYGMLWQFETLWPFTASFFELHRLGGELPMKQAVSKFETGRAELSRPRLREEAKHGVEEAVSSPRLVARFKK